MEELKILFADLHRLQVALKDEIRDIGKQIEALLPGGDWDQISASVNGVAAEAMLMKNIAQAMIDNTGKFLAQGPYDGETVGMLPLENIAQD